MIYDLEEMNSVDEVLDNLIETADIKQVNVDDERVSIRLSTFSGQITINRFIADDHVTIVVE